MAERSQQDSGKERVTATSRPMMSLSARAPSNLSSSTSESLEKRSYGHQDPRSAKAEREDRTGATRCGQRPVNRSQHAAQSGMITMFVLLKSGKLTHWWVIARGNPLWLLGGNTSHNQVSVMRRPSTVLWKRKNFNSTLSLETMRQNQNCRWNQDHSWIGWLIKCGKDKNDLRWMLQKTTKNSLWIEERSWP